MEDEIKNMIANYNEKKRKLEKRVCRAPYERGKKEGKIKQLDLAIMRLEKILAKCSVGTDKFPIDGQVTKSEHTEGSLASGAVAEEDIINCLKNIMQQSYAGADSYSAYPSKNGRAYNVTAHYGSDGFGHDDGINPKWIVPKEIATKLATASW